MTELKKLDNHSAYNPINVNPILLPQGLWLTLANMNSLCIIVSGGIVL